MGLFKPTLDSLVVRWRQDTIPTDARDDRGIKDSVRTRERLLKKTQGLSVNRVAEFGGVCLLACRDYVVSGFQGAGLGNYASDLRDIDDPLALYGQASIAFEEVASLAEDAARTANARNAVASTHLSQANAAVDAMDPDSSSAIVDTGRTVAASFAAGLDADQANQNAFRLGGVALAARILVWGSQLMDRDLGAYGAAKGAVCAVIAARNVAAADAFSSNGGGHDAYQRLSDEAALTELGRQPGITTPNCTSGYSPCLPPASDYDCAGGTGDGPKFTGRVTVTGSDPYGLDSDNDGIGCE